MTKTMTVNNLAVALVQLMKENPKVGKYKVYLSTDPEGNGYSTVDPQYSFQFAEKDKVLTIFPCEDGLTDDDIMPIEMAEVMKEIEDEN